GELHCYRALHLVLLLGLLAKPVVDLARQLAHLFHQADDVRERREVSFLILADPAIDCLLGFAQGQGRLQASVSADLPPLVVPFRGERYAAQDRLSALVAPPYDLIAPAERAGYAARDPHNTVHLILPEAPGARAELDGVGIRMWRVTGAGANELAALAGRAQLYIADGHHRYETAIAFAVEDPHADRVLSFIVSAADPGLTLLATYRIVFGADRDAANLIEGWREWFDVGRVAPCMDRIERLAELGRDRTACIVAFPGAYDVTLVLKRDARLDHIPGLGR